MANMTHIQCQFSLAGLDISDKEKLSALIHQNISSAVGVDNVLGCMLIPRNWPQRCILLCKDQGTLEKLLQDGLTLNGSVFEVIEGGARTKGVMVDDAPFDLPNDVIISELGKIGLVSGGVSLPFLVKKAKTSWISGTRKFYLRNLTGDIPPTITVNHEGASIKLCIRHEGQTRYECRFCKEHVTRGNHSCEKKPVKKCFNCGDTGHMNFNCPTGKLCHICTSPGHIARNCPRNKRPAPGTRRPLTEDPVNPGARYVPKSETAATKQPEAAVPLGQRGVPVQDNQKVAATAATKKPEAVPLGQRGAPIQDGQQPGSSSRKPFTFGDIPIVMKRFVKKGKRNRKRHDSGEPASADTNHVVTEAPKSSVGSPSATSVISEAYSRLNGKVSIDAVMMGDSNSRELSLNSDDDMDIKMMSFWEGGAHINDAQAKFEELSDNIGLSRKQAIITNVGACNFPVNSDGDIERLFSDYVELLGSINRRCPNARVYICSIPPRRGYLNCRVNTQIASLNARLESLATSEEGMTYVNNDVFLTDGVTTLPGLYTEKPEDDIHLSSEGKTRVSCAIFDHMKNDRYREIISDENWSEDV